MKLILLLALSLFAQFSFSEDLATDYRTLIGQKWEGAYTFDSTLLGNTLIAGRCFADGSLNPIGAALLLQQKTQDGGPLGSSTDLITFGAIVKSEVSTNYFDNYSYQDIGPYQNQDEVTNVAYGLSVSGYDVKFSYNDGYYYAVKYVEYGGGQKYFGDVCYFYKNNN